MSVRGAWPLVPSSWKVGRVDGAASAVFRMAFGPIILSEVASHFRRGLIDRYFVEPVFNFTYPGFGWLPQLPAPWIYALWVGLAVCSLLVAIGLYYRAAIATVLVLFCLPVLTRGHALPEPLLCSVAAYPNWTRHFGMGSLTFSKELNNGIVQAGGGWASSFQLRVS
jgi:hypothetical protein